MYAHIGVDSIPFKGAQSVISWRSEPTAREGQVLPHSTDIPSSPPAEVRAALQQLYAPQIAELEIMLGWDSSTG